MGTPTQPEEAGLFAAILLADGVDSSVVLRDLHGRFGDPESVYGPVDFVFSDYYEKEMGKGLRKLYVVFDRAFAQDRLSPLKVWTNSYETRKAIEGKRTVNVDPGFLTRDKLVLASTKNNFHRLYLGKGIFGEVTLHFRKGKFRYFSWTYPDFREPQFCAYLEKARAKLVGRLRKSAGESSDS